MRFGRQVDPVQRMSDMAWDLWEAQPTHPKVRELATAVLAEAPERTGMWILLSRHFSACGDVEVARRFLQDLIGTRDGQYLNAVRELVTLECAERSYVEARRWAEVALHEEPESARGLMDLAEATAMSGDHDEGWRMLDEAVEAFATTRVDDLPWALVHRAMVLLGSYAPPARFISAAEEAVRADPTDEFIRYPLAWGYVHEGRFDDAEEISLRMLREDPTDELAASVVQMVRRVRAGLEKSEQTMEGLVASGMLEQIWTQMRDQQLGHDVVTALAELEQVMPKQLRDTLLPGVDPETARETGGSRELAAWHDGQEPGAGRIWGLDGDFRLMSAAEILEMDDLVEARPEEYPEWQAETLAEAYSQLMTDDAGGYLIEVAMGRLAIRRAGAEDVVVAGSLKDFVWDRVAAWGGKDPRPIRPPAG